MSQEPASYAAAQAELGEILAALEGDAVDVDALTAKVERARTLIEWCRQRVRAVDMTLTDLLEDEPTSEGTTGPGS